MSIWSDVVSAGVVGLIPVLHLVGALHFWVLLVLAATVLPLRRPEWREMDPARGEVRPADRLAG